MPIEENLFQFSMRKLIYVGEKLFHKYLVFKIIVHCNSKNYDSTSEIIENVEYQMHMC